MDQQEEKVCHPGNTIDITNYYCQILNFYLLPYLSDDKWELWQVVMTNLALGVNYLVIKIMFFTKLSDTYA